MASYLIKKDDKTNEIIFMEYELNGYKFKPSSNKASIGIKEITIVKDNMIETVLETKFNRAFAKLLKATYDAIKDSTNNEENVTNALRDIDHLRSVLLNKYQKFLPKEKEKKFFAKLELMEEQLNIKLNGETCEEDDDSRIEALVEEIIKKALILLNSEDASDEDAVIVIDEIVRVRAVLANYYKKKAEKQRENINRLELLEKELVAKRRANIEKEIERRIDSMGSGAKYERETSKKR